MTQSCSVSEWPQMNHMIFIVQTESERESIQVSPGLLFKGEELAKRLGDTVVKNGLYVFRSAHSAAHCCIYRLITIHCVSSYQASAAEWESSYV